MIKDDQVFTDQQRETLKKSLDRIGGEMGVNSYDVHKQNQILSGRLDQMSYLYKNKQSQQRVGVIGAIFRGGGTLVAPGIALALTFTLGIVASQVYNSSYGNRGASQSVDVLRSSADFDGNPATRSVTAANPVEERSKYLEAALRAGLEVKASQVNGKPSMQIYGLEASNPKHLEFKAIASLPPTQSGSVIFIFTK